MAFALTALYLLIFNFILLRVRRLQLNAFKPWVTAAVFNLKFVAGLLIWAVYTFYYKDLQNNDIHKYYNDAVVLHEAATEAPGLFLHLLCNDESVKFQKDEFIRYTSRMKNWERNFDEAPINENRTIIRLNALLMFLSFKTYFVHILFMCFFSLIGWVLLYNSVFATTSLLALLVLLLPSVLFWSSGVMKEPFLVLGLGVFVTGLLNKNTTKKILLLLLGCLLILSVKFYVMACLLPAMVAFMLSKSNSNATIVIGKYVATLALVALVAFNIQRVVPAINPTQILINKHTHSVKEAAYFNAGSRIDIPELTNTADIVKAIPVGIWNTIFRPYLWEGKNVMMLASAVENIVVLALLLLCMFSITKSVIASGTKWSEAISQTFSRLLRFVPNSDKSKRNSTRNDGQFNLALFLLTSSLTYFALIGISTPVLGNIVRYKAPLLPFFLFAFILIADVKPVTYFNWLQREGA